ncbi:MAG TPA: hypothetical protein VHJ38_04880 [Nitrososphaeraceae archaeon]|jgi:hypothetical protein|nr:hypothetical protein [Nitrososphaeraceae archaeon]
MPDRSFEGFFVSSVEFCKHIKFDYDNRKDKSRDNKTGIQCPPGPAGATGAIGPRGITQLINGTNVYLVESETELANNTTTSFGIVQIAASCDTGDFVLNGGFFYSETLNLNSNIIDGPNLPITNPAAGESLPV